MKQEMVFKKVKDVDNSLSAFVDTIYNEFFNQIGNIEEEMKVEKEPLHFLILLTRLEEVRRALRMFENVVEDSTKIVEVEE